MGTIAILSAFVAPVTYATDLDAQINQLNGTIKDQQNQASDLHGQATTLQGQIAQLNSQIASIQSQIADNRQKVADLNNQIDKTKTDIANEKEYLDASIRQMYQQSQISSLEMLASSKNFSDYVDKQQYLDKIKDHISDELAAIKKKQADLQTQQTSLNATLASQSAQESSIATLRSQQNDLLNQTQGQEAAYQKLVADNKSKLSGLYAQRAALDAKNGVTIAEGGGSGGYPYANACTSFTSNCVDPWRYYYRQCVSFAAWHRYYYKDGAAMPYAWGNAENWASHGSDGNAAVGAIAVFPANGSSGAGDVGHVAIVTGVHGGKIDIEEYNWRPFAYDVRYNVPIADIRFVH